MDVDELTHVINFDLPDSVETFVHRIGRTGRAGKEGTAISLVQPFERRKQQVIERHNKQSWQMLSIPTRAQIEARQLEKLQVQVKEALSGERLASFLPIVRELSEEYDAHAIAAAALQIAYDQTRPAWLKADSIPEEDANYATPKPKLRSSSRRSSGDRNRRWVDGKRDKRGGGSSANSKPKLKSSHRESSVHQNQLNSSAAKESAS